MRIVISIEARMSSERLPGKSMKRILGKPMLQLLIERVKNCLSIDEIVVATSKNKENDEIEKLAKKIGVKCFRGSEDDVLDRVLNAAKSVHADVILELWGDSPLIDPTILDGLVKYYLEHNYDCVGTTLPNFPKTYAIGLSALIFSKRILEEVDKLTQKPVDRENVSNYIYEHPEKYKIAPLPCPPQLNYPNLRLTVDEKNDFKLVEKVFKELYPSNQKFTAGDVIEYLRSNPKIAALNKNVVQKKLHSWDKFKND